MINNSGRIKLSGLIKLTGLVAGAGWSKIKGIKLLREHTSYSALNDAKRAYESIEQGYPVSAQLKPVGNNFMRAKTELARYFTFEEEEEEEEVVVEKKQLKLWHVIPDHHGKRQILILASTEKRALEVASARSMNVKWKALEIKPPFEDGDVLIEVWKD